MPKVLFLEQQVINRGDERPRVIFEAGRTYDLSEEAWRRHWSHRPRDCRLAQEEVKAKAAEKAVAVAAKAEEPAKEPEAKAPAPVETKADAPIRSGPSVVLRREDVKPPEPDPDAMTRLELIAMIEQRGIELPPGYVPKQELIRLLDAHR